MRFRSRIRCVWAILVALLLSSCASSSMYPWGIDKTRERLNDLELGMSKQDVVRLMGRPYSREVFTGRDGETLDFLFYITQYTSSGPIPDSDKTPLCFREGKLVGWGRNFYDRTEKYDVTIRQR